MRTEELPGILVMKVYRGTMDCPVKPVQGVIAVLPDSVGYLVSPVPLEGLVRTEREDPPDSPVTEE